MTFKTFVVRAFRVLAVAEGFGWAALLAVVPFATVAFERWAGARGYLIPGTAVPAGTKETAGV